MPRKQPRFAATENGSPAVEPGAHPVGVGVGSATGAAAGAAAGLVAGPVGVVAGVVLGAVTGGLAGKEVAEVIDASDEDAYWERNFRSRSYAVRGADFTLYRPAYRYGRAAFACYPNRQFAEVEREIARGWRKARGGSRLTWKLAKPAVQDAWDRMAESCPQHSATSNGSACRPDPIEGVTVAIVGKHVSVVKEEKPRPRVRRRAAPAPAARGQSAARPTRRNLGR